MWKQCAFFISCPKSLNTFSYGLKLLHDCHKSFNRLILALSFISVRSDVKRESCLHFSQKVMQQDGNLSWYPPTPLLHPPGGQLVLIPTPSTHHHPLRSHPLPLWFITSCITHRFPFSLSDQGVAAEQRLHFHRVHSSTPKPVEVSLCVGSEIK